MTIPHSKAVARFSGRLSRNSPVFRRKTPNRTTRGVRIASKSKSHRWEGGESRFVFYGAIGPYSCIATCIQSLQRQRNYGKSSHIPQPRLSVAMRSGSNAVRECFSILPKQTRGPSDLPPKASGNNRRPRDLRGATRRTRLAHPWPPWVVTSLYASCTKVSHMIMCETARREGNPDDGIDWVGVSTGDRRRVVRIRRSSKYGYFAASSTRSRSVFQIRFDDSGRSHRSERTDRRVGHD